MRWASTLANDTEVFTCSETKESCNLSSPTDFLVNTTGAEHPMLLELIAASHDKLGAAMPTGNFSARARRSSIQGLCKMLCAVLALPHHPSMEWRVRLLIAAILLGAPSCATKWMARGPVFGDTTSWIL